MPSLAVASAAQLRLIWTVGGVPYAVNVIGVRNATGLAITQAIVNTLGTNIKAALTSSGLGAFIHSSVALATVGLRDIRTASQPELLDVAGPTDGTAAGDMLPPQVSLCVTLRTALAGRSFRGRVYLPGFAESANGAGGAAVAGVGTAATTFVPNIQGWLQSAGLDMGVVSRPNPLHAPPSAGFVTPVTAIVVRDLVWDTQRKRAVPGI